MKCWAKFLTTTPPGCIMLAFGVGFAWICCLAITQLSLESRCLAAGYPSVSVTVMFRAFCVRRENQTDKVVPIGSIP
jgi:hypothetical protein